MKWETDVSNSKWVRGVALTILSPLILVIYLAIALMWVQDKIHLFLIDKVGASTEPHEWYAWYPVSYSTWSDSNGQAVWLEKVWRARSSKKTSGYVAYGTSKEDLEKTLKWN